MFSTLDDRYSKSVEEVSSLFGEYNQMALKTSIELRYFLAICEQLNLPLNDNTKQFLSFLVKPSIIALEIPRIQTYERHIKHDIKAIEYYLRAKFSEFNIPYENYIHFGLTSQDVNSLATSTTLHNFNQYYSQLLQELLSKMKQFGIDNDCVFPARTHGQMAVPTTFNKEIEVFVNRIERELTKIQTYKFDCKFGGAVGNLSAHFVAFPHIDWNEFANRFVASYFLNRSQITTQVDNNASISEYFDTVRRVNNILIDFCRDVWMYFSYGYLAQQVEHQEVGSSTMPQKINPIDYENAEGNLELANCVLEFMSNKLQISRMQRDLSDSTVIRNLGVPLGHSVVACKSILHGLTRTKVNFACVQKDLNEHSSKLLAEGVQIILRKHNIKDAYEIVKDIERDGHRSLSGLPLSKEAEADLKLLTLENYTTHLQNHNQFDRETVS